MKLKKGIGIVSYGTSIPTMRIKTADIAMAWGKRDNPGKALGVDEKAVASADEDAITLGVNAGAEALAASNIIPSDIGAIYTGSESHPYAVKSSSAVIGEALCVGNNFMAADLEFACKAGTAALQIILSQIQAGFIEYGLAVGTDTAQSRPGDALEYAASAASAAYVLGKNDLIAEILYTNTFTSDNPDFWRREHEIYPSHAGKFSGEPSYMKHISNAVQITLTESGMKPSDFDHVVFHMPNGRFPKNIAAKLGFSEAQMAAGFVVPHLGNSYSACSLIGLASVLDSALPNQKILLCSYGSGSGSDAFVLHTTDHIAKYQRPQTVHQKIATKHYIQYPQYLRFMKKIKS